MIKEKQFYIECLKNGKMRHDHISDRMKRKFGITAKIVRDILVEEGIIRKAGFVVRSDGKKGYFYELTSKKNSQQKDKKVSNPNQWEDGSFKSKGNAFDWRSFSKGLYSLSELAAVENGRKFGMSTASKQILPRVSI